MNQKEVLCPKCSEKHKESEFVCHGKDLVRSLCPCGEWLYSVRNSDGSIKLLLEEEFITYVAGLKITVVELTSEIESFKLMWSEFKDVFREADSPVKSLGKLLMEKIEQKYGYKEK